MLWTHIISPVVNYGQFFDGKLLSLRAGKSDCSWLTPEPAFCGSHARLSSCQHVLWIAKKSIRGSRPISRRAPDIWIARQYRSGHS
jgi:hypothetical protein